MSRAPRPERRPRALPPAAVLVIGGLVLSGCASISRDGPVHRADPAVSATPSAEASTVPPGPAPGASPEEVVRGFLSAGQSEGDDYAVARQYLTEDRAATWRPEGRAVVFAGAAGIDRGLSDDQVRVSVDTRAVIDRDGVMERRAAGSSEQLDIRLTRVDDQWRISGVPDGVLVPVGNLDELYAPLNLWFLDPSGQHAVPDPRWFPRREGTSTALTRALLAGPAPHLRGAVTTRLPGDAQLQGSTVPVQDGRATVRLTSDEFDPVDVEANQRMQAQLQRTLQALPSVDEVEIMVNGTTVDLGDRGWEPTPTNQVPERQVGLDGDRLVHYRGGQTEPVPGVGASLRGRDPSAPAMAYDRSQYAALVDRGSSLVTFSPSSPGPAERFSGRDLTDPSIDRQGWAWSADAQGRVRAARTGTSDAPVTLSADWLRDTPVAALRISRGGTRALIVTDEGKDSRVLLAGVLRDDDGTPSALNEPYALDLGGPGEPLDRVAWLSETQFVAASSSRGAASPRLYDVSGTYVELPVSQDGVDRVSAGNGESEIYIETSKGLCLLTGESWSPQTDEVSDVSFAG